MFRKILDFIRGKRDKPEGHEIDKEVLIYRHSYNGYQVSKFSRIKKDDIFCQFPDHFPRRWDRALSDAYLRELEIWGTEWAVRAEKI